MKVKNVDEIPLAQGKQSERLNLMKSLSPGQTIQVTPEEGDPKPIVLRRSFDTARRSHPELSDIIIAQRDECVYLFRPPAKEKP